MNQSFRRLVNDGSRPWPGPLVARGDRAGVGSLPAAGPRRAPGVRDEQGLTVVELVVAMLLLSVALVTLAVAMPPALQEVVAGGRQTTATLLAQQALDQARARSYDAVCGLDTGGTFIPISGHAGFSRRVEVTPLAASCPAPSVGETLVTVTVTVRVAGLEGGGTSGSRDTTLVTIRTR